MTSQAERSDTASVWLVIDGNLKPPGICVSKWKPIIPCGRASPPLPVVIECLSIDEAKSIGRVLQPIAQSLGPRPTSKQVLEAFERQPAVKGLFRPGEYDFYAVIIGSPCGILRTKEGAEKSKGSFTHHCWTHCKDFWQALAYMIVKGIDELMPPSTLQNSWSETSDAHSNVPIDNIPPSTQIIPHYTRGPPLSTTCAIPDPSREQRANTCKQGRSDLSIDDTLPCTQNASSPARERLGGTPPVARKPSDSEAPEMQIPIVFTHLRTLRGVFRSCHHSVATPESTEQRALTLGTAAGRYLLAHGYAREDIETIIEMRRDVATGAEFAMRLAGEGMALTEATYLWGLIVQSTS